MDESHVAVALDAAHLQPPNAARQLRQLLACGVRQVDDFQFLRLDRIPHVKLLHNHSHRLDVLRRPGDDQDVAGLIGRDVEPWPGVAPRVDCHKSLVDDIGDSFRVGYLDLKNPVAG